MPRTQPAPQPQPQAEEIVTILGVMLFAPYGVEAWSLINLALSVLGLLAAAFTVARAVLQKKKEREKEPDTHTSVLHSVKEVDNKGLIEGVEEKDKYNKRRRLIWLEVAVGLSIVGATMFVAAQNTSTLMVLVDWWTAGHAAVIAGVCVSSIASFRRHERADQHSGPPQD